MKLALVYIKCEIKILKKGWINFNCHEITSLAKLRTICLKYMYIYIFFSKPKIINI